MALESESKTAVTLPAAPGSAGPGNPLASDPELLNDFILESREHLTSIELQLLILDQDPAHAEAIHSIFRGFHTIKGMAGFLDLDAVREVAHEVETVLDLARNSRLVITPAIIDRILESKDYLNGWMSELESMLATGKAPAMPGHTELLATIRGVGAAALEGRDASVSESGVVDGSVTAGAAGPVTAARALSEDAAAVGLLELARGLDSVSPDEAADPSAPAVPESAEAGEDPGSAFAQPPEPSKWIPASWTFWWTWWVRW